MYRFIKTTAAFNEIDKILDFWWRMTLENRSKWEVL